MLPLRGTIAHTFRRLQDRYESQDLPAALPTGFADLDQIIGGLWPGEVTIIAALPGAGATTFALNVASFTSLALRRTVAFFSLDQNAEEIGLRLIALHGGIDLSRLRSGQMEDADWPACTAASELLAGANLLIDDTRTFSFEEFRSRAIHAAATMHLDLLIIDNVQHFLAFVEDNRTYFIDRSIARQLQSLTRELNIPILAISRLAGDNYFFSGALTESYFRGCGPIECAADMLFFLHRAECRNPKTKRKGTAELIVARQRRGPLGTVKFAFDGRYARFSPRNPCVAPNAD